MKFIKGVFCTLVVLFMLSTVLYSIHLTSSLYCIYDFVLWLDLGLVATLCYQIGLSLLYLLFVVRLTYAFKGTTLATSRYLFLFFIFGLVIQMFLACMVMVFFRMSMEHWHW
eukprot:UN11766